MCRGYQSLSSENDSKVSLDVFAQKKNHPSKRITDVSKVNRNSRREVLSAKDNHSTIPRAWQEKVYVTDRQATHMRNLHSALMDVFFLLSVTGWLPNNDVEWAMRESRELLPVIASCSIKCIRENELVPVKFHQEVQHCCRSEPVWADWSCSSISHIIWWRVVIIQHK